MTKAKRKGEQDMWEKFELGENTTVQDALAIIEDALSYLFEFKVENHSIYFRQLDGTM